MTIEGQDLVLLKPQTYMNRSGIAVRALVDYLKAPVAELLVVHDELDLPAGVARLKFGGGPGGHNGMRDVVTHCGADFWRLRLGIGHPGDRSMVIDYVLQRAAPADEEAIVGTIPDGARCTRRLPERGFRESHASPAQPFERWERQRRQRRQWPGAQPWQ